MSNILSSEFAALTTNIEQNTPQQGYRADSHQHHTKKFYKRPRVGVVFPGSGIGDILVMAKMKTSDCITLMTQTDDTNGSGTPVIGSSFISP